MGKFFMLWEVDHNRTPIDPKERGIQYGGMLAMVKQYIEEGMILDHGTFVGEGKGYAIFEGAMVELSKMTEKFVPFVKFKVHPIVSVSQLEEVIRSLSE